MSHFLLRRHHTLRQSLLHHHQSRAFLLGSRQLETYSSSGTAIEISDKHFVLDDAFAPLYRPSTDAIIRNYSSALTAKNVEHLQLPLNELTQKRPFFTNFCGVIEQLPRRRGLFVSFAFVVFALFGHLLICAIAAQPVQSGRPRVGRQSAL